MQEWAPEIRVDEPFARRLIAEQFPEVEQRSIRLLGEGWDNTMWLVDEEWVFRFPRRAMVLAGLENEIVHLPRLARLLPLSIPVPTLIGRPSEGFEWPFYGAPFLPGRELAEADIGDETRVLLGHRLGEFLRALHSLEPDAALPVDPVLRADMSFRVPRTRERLAELADLGLWNAPPAVHDIVEAAAVLGPPEPTCLVHGDLHLRHLLVDEQGAATAVIDWIDLSRNESSVDLVLYWASLPPEGRDAFRAAYGPIADDRLLRARILGLFLCGTLVVYGHHERLPRLEREALEALDRIIRTG